MRLIDADALKEATKTFIDCDGFNPVWEIIDHAPTVDAISNDEGYEMYGKGYMRGYERGKAEAIPKGEWIIEHDWVHCSSCGHEQNYPSNFCSKCGANMRKGGAK